MADFDSKQEKEGLNQNQTLLMADIDRKRSTSAAEPRYLGKYSEVKPSPIHGLGD